MKNKLALSGGSKLIDYDFKKYNSIGKEEVEAVKKVVERGVLSDFLGSWDKEKFYGGTEVRALEAEWSEYFGVKHSVTVNSNTSGLICAVGALGLEPGDEVIVPPWTMTATATSVLVWGGIPVFADIKEDTYTIDPVDIEKKISKRTKGIIAVNILGQACDYEKILALAKKHNLWVIEDNAQAPGVKYNNKHLGTFGDIGVFSLNYHKHINTGEGGVCVTEDDELAERMQLIRNHGEAVVERKNVTRIDNIIGYNFRMTEMEAAIGREQLKKLNNILLRRELIAGILNDGLRKFEWITAPSVEKGSQHSYYLYALRFDLKKIDVRRETLCNAIKAEGVLGIAAGYTNIHLQPIYQQKIAFGKSGYPWSLHPNIVYDYSKGICPTAERLHEKEFACLQFCNYDYDERDIANIIKVFDKIWDNKESLKDLELANEKCEN